jgi:hypothetical protein
MKFRSISQTLKQKVGVIHELPLLLAYRVYTTLEKSGIGENPPAWCASLRGAHPLNPPFQGGL